jgi:hypothetical protein
MPDIEERAFQHSGFYWGSKYYGIVLHCYGRMPHGLRQAYICLVVGYFVDVGSRRSSHLGSLVCPLSSRCEVLIQYFGVQGATPAPAPTGSAGPVWPQGVLGILHQAQTDERLTSGPPVL